MSACKLFNILIICIFTKNRFSLAHVQIGVQRRLLGTEGSTPESSSVELPSWGACHDILLVSKVGPILTPMCSCGESSELCCSIGKSISSYSSKFVHSKLLLSSSRSTSMINCQRPTCWDPCICASTMYMCIHR